MSKRISTHGDFVRRASVNFHLLARCRLLLRRKIRPRLRFHAKFHNLVDIEIQQIIRRGLPNPHSLAILGKMMFRRLKQHPRRRHKNIIKEPHRDSDTHVRRRQDLSGQDFAFEGAEDNHAEVDIDVYDTGAVADESFAGLEYVVEGYAETYAVDDFVGVFQVDVVFDCLRAALFEVLG